jgi:hypothetical protein
VRHRFNWKGVDKSPLEGEVPMATPAWQEYQRVKYRKPSFLFNAGVQLVADILFFICENT